MILNGEKFIVKETFDTFMTVPDCIVYPKNKLGKGHGEAKFYIASKDVMRAFYGGTGFVAKCFMLKSDIIDYMYAIKNEYIKPTQPYRGISDLPSLWNERMQKVSKLPDVITFNVSEQTQIDGPRGYVNSNDEGYQLIREVSLPLVSYISAMQLEDKSHSTIYYWKLFVDFDAIQEKENALVFNYGKKETITTIKIQTAAVESEKLKEWRNARDGQGKYRAALLEECPYCPITKINDERLLIASHIKPWAASTDKEKIDSKNGYILSPMYDKLFDRGFITFTDDRRMIVSNWISPKNCERIGIHNGDFIQALPMDDKRREYLKFHRTSVFHGIIEV